MTFAKCDANFIAGNNIAPFLVCSSALDPSYPSPSLSSDPLVANSFRLVIRSFKPPTCNLRQCKTVVLKVNGRDTVTENLTIGRILVRLFRLCALSDISAYFARTVETTRVRISCHSVKAVLIVRWHHLHTIILHWPLLLTWIKFNPSMHK